MNALAMLAVCAAALAASCSDSHPQNQVGGETHFLKACVEGMCGDGLECVCGICTEACVSRIDCARLGEQATCVPLEESSALCDGAPSAERVCDVRCDESRECSALGEDFECVEERCRPEQIATQLADLADAGVDAAVGGEITDPLVLFVVDTSGSMERKTQCTCTSASCDECLPRCSEAGSDKNRWAHVLEALTGTFEDFSCESHARESYTDQYDHAYPVPYHEPKGTQRNDGILQTYASRVRFGLATFDGVGSYERDVQLSELEFSIEQSAGQEGMWSYPPDDAWTELGSDAAAYQIYRYPGCPHPYVMNKGIRGRDADEGALFVDMGETPRAEAVAAIKRSLSATRPYGGTPIAASLDDVRALFEHDPAMAPERAMPEHPRHVVLITDGRPDDDYRNVNCDCNEPAAGKNCAHYLSPTESTSDMRCPYPEPAEAARLLLASSAVDAVHVIGFAVADDEVAKSKVNEMAAQGGTSGVFADTAEELKLALTRTLQNILDEPQTQPMLDDSCVSQDFVYADGARWLTHCGFCECLGGLVQCTVSDDCRHCERDWHCKEGEHCSDRHICTTSTSQPECDAPLNYEAVCGVDGITYDSPCDVPFSVAHGGACEPKSCPWVLGEVAHGEIVPSDYGCGSCVCFEGELQCDSCAPDCSSLVPCRDDEICVLPVDQCVATEAMNGFCEKIPLHCAASPLDEPLFCACDGNLYTECELLLNGQNKADSSVCTAD